MKAAVPETEAELQQLRRRINRRSWIVTVVALVIVAAFTIVFVFVVGFSEFFLGE